MNRLKFYFFLFIVALFITACSKDGNDSLDNPDNQIIQETKTVLRSSNDGDQVLIESFYQDVLSLQARSGFYDEFYNLYGFFDWSNYQSYENPDGDPILVMPVVKSHLLASTGIMIYHQNSTNKKMSFVSRTELISSIRDVEINQTIRSQSGFLLRSDIKRGLGGDRELLSTTRDGEDETEPPCEGGEFVTICVKFDDGNAVFAQQHDNFEFFLKEQIENLNLSANITDSEWAKWYTAFNGLASYGVSDLDLYSTISEFYNLTSGIFDPIRALEMFNLYKLMRYAYFETFGLGKDDVLGTYITNTTSNSFFECFDIWIWCWDEYPDFELTGVVVLPGPTGTSIPPFQETYDELRFCEGYLEPHDTGQDNPDSLHPNYAFCEIWMTYLEDCILPNATLAEGYNGGYAHLIMQWAQFQYYYPSDFNEAIADSEGCGTTTSSLPPAISEECRDVVNSFEETFGINLSIADRKAILFGIDCENLECVTSNPELVEATLELLDSDFVDPCAPNKTTKDIVNDILMSMGEDCDLGKLESALAGSDYIGFGNLKEECPKYYCIMKNLSSGADNWFCNNIAGINSSTKFTYNFEFTETSRISTTYNNSESGKKNTVTTTIPTSYCDGTTELGDLELASKFVHETFHAKFYGLIFDEDTDGIVPDLNFLQNLDYWENLVNKIFEPDPPSANHHALFLTEYIDIMMEALWKLNGMKGSIDDYEYYAHILINTQQMADHANNPDMVEDFPWLANLGLENFNINDYKNNWESNILDIYGFNLDCL